MDERMLVRVILALSILVLLFGSAGALTLKAGEVTGAQGSMVRLPVIIGGASKVGSVDLVLSYDQNTVKAIGVDRGTLAGNAYMESNTGVPGEVRIGLADASGIAGTGDLIQVSFLLSGGAGSRSPVSIRRAEVHDLDLAAVTTETQDGSIAIVTGPATTQAGSAFPSLLLSFGVALAAVLCIRRRTGGR